MFQHTPHSQGLFSNLVNNRLQVTSEWFYYFFKNIVATSDLQACYVIHESVSKVSLCSISQMIQTSLIQPPTTIHTHIHSLTRKLMIWHHHRTSSHNTGWWCCTFLISVLNCILIELDWLCKTILLIWKVLQVKALYESNNMSLFGAHSHVCLQCLQCSPQMFGFGPISLH